MLVATLPVELFEFCVWAVFILVSLTPVTGPRGTVDTRELFVE